MFKCFDTTEFGGATLQTLFYLFYNKMRVLVRIMVLHKGVFSIRFGFRVRLERLCVTSVIILKKFYYCTKNP